MPEGELMTTTAEPIVWMDRYSAATYIGVSTDSIDRYVRRGYLPAFKVPGAANAPVRFKRSDLDALLVPVPRQEEEE